MMLTVLLPFEVGIVAGSLPARGSPPGSLAGAGVALVVHEVVERLAGGLRPHTVGQTENSERSRS